MAVSKKAKARSMRALAQSLSRRQLLLRVLPSEPWNVRTGNADIGQFALVEVGQFPHRGAVTLPGVQVVDDG